MRTRATVGGFLGHPGLEFGITLAPLEKGHVSDPLHLDGLKPMRRILVNEDHDPIPAESQASRPIGEER